MADDDRPLKRAREEEGSAVYNPLAPVGWVTWNLRQNNYELQQRKAQGDDVLIPGSLSYEVNNAEIGDIALLHHKTWDKWVDDGNEPSLDLLATTIFNRAGTRTQSHEDFVSDFTFIGFVVSRSDNREKGGNQDFAATCSGVISRINDGDVDIRAGEFVYWESPWAPHVRAEEQGLPLLDVSNGLRGRANERYVPILRPIRRDSHLSAESIWRIMKEREDFGGADVFSASWFKRFDRADINDAYDIFARANNEHVQAAMYASMHLKTGFIMGASALARIVPQFGDAIVSLSEQTELTAKQGPLPYEFVEGLNKLLNFAESGEAPPTVTIEGTGENNGAAHSMSFPSYLIAHYQQKYSPLRIISAERSTTQKHAFIRDSLYRSLTYLIQSCAAAREHVTKRAVGQCMNNSLRGGRMDLNIGFAQ